MTNVLVIEMFSDKKELDPKRS